MDLLYQRACFLSSLWHCSRGFSRPVVWEPEQSPQGWGQGESMTFLPPPPGWWLILGGQGLPIHHTICDIPMLLCPSLWLHYNPFHIPLCPLCPTVTWLVHTHLCQPGVGELRGGELHGTQPSAANLLFQRDTHTQICSLFSWSLP